MKKMTFKEHEQFYHLQNKEKNSRVMSKKKLFSEDKYNLDL